MKFFVQTLALLVVFGISVAEESTVKITTKKGVLEGAYEKSGDQSSKKIALIISGSGSTDRNGNSPVTSNNALKYLAQDLSEIGVSSIRYDKRGVAKSQAAAIEEQELRFEHFIEDANAWVDYIASNYKQFEIIVIGHSEGALIGSIVSQSSKVSKFISIAGAGVSADKILRAQLNSQPDYLQIQAKPILDQLSKGELVKNIHPATQMLFRPSIQPYLISWFKYDPGKEIAKLNKPILIVQGGNDLQISVDDAKKLDAASQRSQIKIIPKMNHILKSSAEERTKNLETYQKPELPNEPTLIKVLQSFLFEKV